MYLNTQGQDRAGVRLFEFHPRTVDEPWRDHKQSEIEEERPMMRHKSVFGHACFMQDAEYKGRGEYEEGRADLGAEREGDSGRELDRNDDNDSQTCRQIFLLLHWDCNLDALNAHQSLT